MDIKGKTALVTGANRGLGSAFVQELLNAGAAKVYAGARDPRTVTEKLHAQMQVIWDQRSGAAH